MGIRRSPTAPLYGWNEAAGRYITLSTGRFVTFVEVRSALDAAIDSSQNEIRRLSQALQSGNISLADWQTAMMQEIKQGHLAAIAAAKGGFAELTQADYGRAGQAIRTQYEYLRNFANQVGDGRQPLDGYFLRRADMYADSSRGLYHRAERIERAKRGMTEERRIATARESCPDCIEYEARGWQPIGSLPNIGDSQCLTNCKCYFEYR